MNIFTQFFKKNSRDPVLMQSNIKRDLIRQEARVGRDVFGPIPAGHAREFFRIEKQTWIWQETWPDVNGVRQHRHTKFIIRDREIVKSVNSGSYEKLSIDEAKNFTAAVTEYVKRVKKDVYKSKQTAHTLK